MARGSSAPLRFPRRLPALLTRRTRCHPGPRIHRLPQRLDYALIPAPLGETRPRTMPLDDRPSDAAPGPLRPDPAECLREGRAAVHHRDPVVADARARGGLLPRVPRAAAQAEAARAHRAAHARALPVPARAGGQA